MSNYYEVLGLDSKMCGKPLSQEKLKAAYRQALLGHHPDKGGRHNVKQPANSVVAGVTVDDITLAYKTFSNLNQRAVYDRLLVQEQTKSGEAPNGRVHQTGLETVDLDSLAFDDSSQTWSRSCRCGDTKGFIVREAELEKQVEHGELTVGCRGCSLWLRVLFGVEDDG